MLYMSCLWKQLPDEMLHQKTLAKKALFFLVPGFRSKHFGHLIQKPKLMASLSSYHSLDLCLPMSLGPSKLVKELFCLSLKKKIGRGGGYLIPKMMRNFFLLCFSQFPIKIKEDDQNPEISRNFSLFKIGFEKKFLKGFQK